jgi:hypothetical protein
MLDQSGLFGVSSKFLLAGALDRPRNLLYLGSHDKGLYQVRLDEVVVYEEFNEAEVKGIAGNDSILGILSNQGLEIRESANSKKQVTLQQFKKVQADYFKNYPHKNP